MFYKARQQFFRFFRIRSSLHTHAWKMTCATTDPRQNYYNIINGTQGNLCNKQTNKCKKSMQHYHMTERSHVPSRPCSHLHWTLNRESEANRLNWQWVDVYQYLIHHFPTHVSTHLHFLSIHMLPKIFSESISGQLSFIKLDLFWFLWKVNRVEWAGTVLGQRLLWKGITEESRHFRISLLHMVATGQPGLVAWHGQPGCRSHHPSPPAGSPYMPCGDACENWELGTRTRK